MNWTYNHETHQVVDEDRHVVAQVIGRPSEYGPILAAAGGVDLRQVAFCLECDRFYDKRLECPTDLRARIRELEDEVEEHHGAQIEETGERLRAEDIVEALTTPRPLAEWTEDDKTVLWWRLPVEEPPWVGSPGDDGWLTDYYTHWTELPARLAEPSPSSDPDRRGGRDE